MPVLTHDPVTAPPTRILRYCDDLLEIDPERRQAWVDGRMLALRQKEYELLLALAHRAGVVVSRPVLLEQVWEYSEDVRTRTLDVHISALRRHLQASPLSIETVRGQGYRLRWPGVADVSPSTRSKKRSRAAK